MRRDEKILTVWLMVLAGVVSRCPPAAAYDWPPPPNKVAVLAVGAHPDDEGIFFGGALPYYSTVLNLPTMLVCMTHGWGDVRDDELRCAAWNYGLRYAPLFGRFTDINSGAVTNNPYTNTIDMTWDYWAGIGFKGDGSDVEAGKARAINYVAEQIRRYRPDVIITHDLNGEYGHDNHKATAYAVTQAFFVAADPNATATNLVGLAPWQAQKLYVHLYPTNRFFHEFWERPYAALTNETPRQVTTNGLTCDVSQGPFHWVVGSVYTPFVYYSKWPSEWWGLYASAVGPDTVLSSNLVVQGYTVPAGAAAGNFLEHVSLGPLYQPPVFTANPLTMPPAATYDAYTGRTLADYVIAIEPVSTLTFGKISGPAWLNVGLDGSLTGTPTRADAGTNTWVVGLTNQDGVTARTTLTMRLLGRPIGKENLVGWWRLSETNPASPVAANSAPLSPDGVSYGGALFGQPGARSWTRNSVQFDGTDGKIDVPFMAALNPPVFTVTLWVNVMGGSGTYRSPLTSRKSPPPAGYLFYANPDDFWQFWVGNGSGWTTLTAGPVVTNTWIHLAGTYDGTNACFYTNGTLAVTATAALQLNDTFPLRIGAGATEGAGAMWFPGRVDDVRVYRVALDAPHVWAVFTAPPTISDIRKQIDGSMLLGGAAEPGQTYVLLATTIGSPGRNWMPITTNVADINGYCQFIDPDALNYTRRSYRLVMP